MHACMYVGATGYANAAMAQINYVTSITSGVYRIVSVCFLITCINLENYK